MVLTTEELRSLVERDATCIEEPRIPLQRPLFDGLVLHQGWGKRLLGRERITGSFVDHLP